MEKTDNYQLPQWSKNDFIKMDDFNDAFSTLDGALKAQADAVADKAGGEEITAVRQEIQETRAANCLVKLAGPLVTEAANAAMEFDLSQVDMTQVAALLLTLSAGATGGTMSLSVNGSSVGTVCSNNRSTSAGVIWVVPLGDKVACHAAMACNVSGISSGGSGTTDAVNWTEITTVKISGGSSAGATATLFAVKK